MRIFVFHIVKIRINNKIFFTGYPKHGISLHYASFKSMNDVFLIEFIICSKNIYWLVTKESILARYLTKLCNLQISACLLKKVTYTLTFLTSLNNNLLQVLISIQGDS